MKSLRQNILHNIFRYHFAVVASLATGCEEFISIDPPKTEIVSETVFTDDGSANSAISGIYSLMMTNQSFTRAGMEEFAGLLSDELTNYATRADQVQFYQNAVSPQNGYVQGIFWREAYKYVNNANAILEGLNQSSALSTDTKNRLEGEARFVRAFCHFYLTMLFGDVPYVTTTDYRVNAVIARKARSEVLEEIENDLTIAEGLLPETYTPTGGQRVHPIKPAAQAMLARLYLYREEWTNAEQYASKLIDNTSLYELIEVDKVFLKNSRESIWQLQPVVPGSNTPQAQLFILTGAPNSSSRRVTLTNDLVESFEEGDARAVNWINSFSNASATWYYAFKYKVASDPTLSEYSTVLRLAEQYLIRAEARTMLGNFDGAQEDLDAIRTRAGLPATTASDEASLLSAIIAERRAELFAEWGHRWFDLVRMGKADEVLGPIKADWQSTDVLLPIPDSERQLNPNLSQNPGY